MGLQSWTGLSDQTTTKSEYATLVIFISRFTFRFQTSASSKIPKTIEVEFRRDFYPSVVASLVA